MKLVRPSPLNTILCPSPRTYPCSSSVDGVASEAVPYQTRTLQSESITEESCKSRQDARFHEVKGSEMEDPQR